MLHAIKHGLRNLANLSGRDSRRQFWFFALFLMLARWALGMVATVPLMASTMSTAMRSASTSADPQATATAVQANMTAALPQLMVIGMVIGVVSTAMLLASLVRRLHDSNLSGWFVLLPGVPYLASLAATPGQVAHTMQVMQRGPQTGGMMLRETNWSVAALAWLALALLVALAVRPATPGPNRYGAAPVDKDT
jgi:uncharacterized membrane protein YhaH (DUF805 family)